MAVRPGGQAARAAAIASAIGVVGRPIRRARVRLSSKSASCVGRPADTTERVRGVADWIETNLPRIVDGQTKRR